MKKQIFFHVLFAALFFNTFLFPQAEEFEKKIKILTDEKILMPDGINLAADIYLPEEEGKFPVILIRTPYGKKQKEYFGKHWSANGFAVVIQDCRGKWNSEGDYIPFVNELSDGNKTISWIKEQEWYNGKIGMWGSSYLSYCALTVASSKNPDLNSIFNISGFFKSNKTMFPGGANHLMLNLLWILHEETQTKRPLKQFKPQELFSYLPLKDVFKSIGIESNLWTNPASVMNMNDSLSAVDIDIPVFHFIGWNDFTAEAALENYELICSNNKNNQFLFIGPWVHDQYYTDDTKAGDEDFGQEAAMGISKLSKLTLQWFNHTLKAESNEVSSLPPAKIFIMGKNKWEGFQEFPPKNSRIEKLYLFSSSGANSSSGDGKLSFANTETGRKDNFIFDPNNPVTTYGGANFHFIPQLLGIRDQRKIEERNDVLIYTSDPLEKSITILGSVKAVLKVSTEGKDTDFTAKLVEVREDGYAGIIRDGIIRLSKRNSHLIKEEIIPGKIYNIEIDLGSTAIEIKKGSRVRLEVSSSNFPKYDRNPNTGEESVDAAVLLPVKQTIYHEGSYLSLNILEENSNEK